MFEDEPSPFFELCPDVACMLDRNGDFDRVNGRWEACLGWKPADLERRSFLDFIEPTDRPAAAAELARVIRGRSPVDLQHRFRRKDGVYRGLRWRAAYWPQFRLICAVACSADERRPDWELVEAGDRERERIGRDLHDGLCQNLAGIAALSATLARKLALRDDTLAPAAAELTVLLQHSVGDARDLARGLNATGVLQMGLPVALEALAANVAALHPVECAFIGEPGFPRLEPSIETHMYRIAQEAVNNTIAHARATRIDVSLRVDDGHASLRIRDNGLGIPRGQAEAGAGALQTMRHRARIIGASLDVQRINPKGTLVTCRLSLPAGAG